MFDETRIAIKANFEELTILETSIITLDNIEVNAVDTMVAFTDGTSLNLPNGDVDFVIIGNVQDKTSTSFGSYSVNVQGPPPPLLDAANDEVIY